MTTCCPGSRHRAGFVWSAPGHARFSPPASRSAQRSPSVNFTGNRTPCRKNRRPRRHWQRVQHLAHPGRGGRLSDSSSADHPTADQRRLPSRARRRSLRGSSAADVQNRSARAIPAFITFDFQRSEVASRPGNGPCARWRSPTSTTVLASRAAISFTAGLGPPARIHSVWSPSTGCSGSMNRRALDARRPREPSSGHRSASRRWSPANTRLDVRDRLRPRAIGGVVNARCPSLLFKMALGVAGHDADELGEARYWFAR